MAVLNDLEPIHDDEYLYRRIPCQPTFYNPTIDDKPSPQAFKPRENDIDGLSMTRSNYISAEEFALKGYKSSYYVGKLKVEHIRNAGMSVIAKPLEENPGHVIIPELRWDNRNDNRSKEFMQILSQKICMKVLGPLP